MLPINPARLVGSPVVYTAEAVRQVPALDTTLREVTAYHGIVSGEPMYTVISQSGNPTEAFLSELRLFVGGPAYSRPGAELLDLVHAVAY